MKLFILASLLLTSLLFAREPDRHPPQRGDGDRRDHYRPRPRPPVYIPVPMPHPRPYPYPYPYPTPYPSPYPYPSYSSPIEVNKCKVELWSHAGKRAQLIQSFEAPDTCELPMNSCLAQLEQSGFEGSCRYHNEIEEDGYYSKFGSFKTRVCTYTLFEESEYNYGGNELKVFIGIQSGQNFFDQSYLNKACEEAQSKCLQNQDYGTYCLKTFSK